MKIFGQWKKHNTLYFYKVIEGKYKFNHWSERDDWHEYTEQKDFKENTIFKLTLIF